MNAQAGEHPGDPLARLVHGKQFGHDAEQGVGARIGAAEQGSRHGGAQHVGADRMPLGVVGVEQAFRRRLAYHLGQLPSQVDRVLQAGVETLPADREVHVRRVAGQQHPSLAVGRRLPGHVGEPGDPGRAVHAEIRSPHGDERLAEIAQGGLGSLTGVLLTHHDPHSFAILEPADPVDALLVAADAQFRLLSRLNLGDQRAGGWVPPGKLDAGRLADKAAPSVAPHEVPRPQPLAVGQFHVDARVILREARHLASAVDQHPQLADPVGQDPLDVVLPEPERVRVAAGEVADVQLDAGEVHDRIRRPPRNEPVGDPALVEDLDAAGVQAPGSRPGQLWTGALLDDGHVGPGQRKLGRQHHSGRASPGDHYGVPGHGRAPGLVRMTSRWVALVIAT